MKTTINKLIKICEELKKIYPEMNVNMIMTFLEVARGNGINGRDIEEKLDLNHTSAARMLRYFDKYQADKTKKGADLFDVRIDPTDYRSKVRYLNKDGEKLLKRLERIIEEE